MLTAGYMCSSCEYSPEPEPPIGGPIGGGNSCEIIGGQGGPFTYRIDLRSQYGGFTGFSARRSNFSTYGCGTNNCGAAYGDCDPDYSRPYIKRYFKSPEQPQLGITGFGIDYACLSWKSDKPSRVMALSGRNVYRYSGYLAGDTGASFNTLQTAYSCTGSNYIRKYYPWITTGGVTSFCSDTNINPIGVSGISEMEGTISGRQFPLADYVSGLPLWGQQLSNSVGITNEYDITCGSTASCFGCECLTGPTALSVAGIGHYGVGLTSQKPYNPQGYISEGSIDYVGDITPIWRGIPSCSVWSFVNAVYDRLAYLSVRSGLVSPPAGLTRNALMGLSGDFFEVQNFIDKHTELLENNPHTVVNEFKDPGYSLKNYMAYFSRDWTNSVNALSDNLGYWTFRIIPPNVFLWDQTPYDSAVNSEDKWKHVYIIGNANVLFDSGMTYPDGLTNNYDDSTFEPVGNFDSNVDIFSTDDVRHHIFRLDEINHAMNRGRPGLTANSARLVVFPSASVDHGTTAEFQVSIKPLPPYVIHGDCQQSGCGVYQIETNSLASDGLETYACACSVCARLGDGTTRYPAYTENRLYTQLGGSIPSCYLDLFLWSNIPKENLYFPHPRLLQGSDGNAGDCRYYGPRRLNWYIPF
jgi:hypothetical protein